MMAVTSKCISN